MLPVKLKILIISIALNASTIFLKKCEIKFFISVFAPLEAKDNLLY